VADSYAALRHHLGHRTLTIVGKGGKTVTIPLAPRTARAVDLAIGERDSGPIFVTGDGHRLDRHGAAAGTVRVEREASGRRRRQVRLWRVEWIESLHPGTTATSSTFAPD
jgi:integrase